MNFVEAEIISLSKQIVEMELHKDADALSRLICDDYIGVDPSGILINKEVSVGRYRRADFKLLRHAISEISVFVFGETATEIGVMNLQGQLGTFEFGGRYRYTHTWLKTDSGWKVRASQLTPILRDA